MTQPKGATRRNLLIIGASVAFLASACSTSGNEKATSTTTVPASTSSTEAATTSTEAPSTTEAAPETTTAPTTTEPAPGPTWPEDVAVGFVRAAINGDDPSSFVNDPAVAAAATLEWADVADGDRSGFTVEIDPDYVDPISQGGEGGQCQLMGDVSLQCAVLVSSPATANGEGSPTLYAIYVTNFDPASSLDDPKYVDYFVIDFEPIAG
ncbi:MAG: hypothetical protein ABI239_09325 [Aquihabitans sp.]